MTNVPITLDARGAIGIGAASAGMVLFAWFSHQGLPWGALGAAGLLLAASAIGWAQFGGASPAVVLGLERLTAKAAAFSAIGILLGIGAGLWHRSSLGLPLQSAAGIQPFVVIACAIGATEELMYRGWLLGRARAFGWPAAVLVAAVAHAAYKTALFAWPSVPSPVDFAAVAAITTVGGLFLGALRYVSGSVIPAVLAHVAFDFVVYRAVADAPWWVWN